MNTALPWLQEKKNKKKIKKLQMTENERGSEHSAAVASEK
jgi:hypothetical protein